MDGVGGVGGSVVGTGLAVAVGLGLGDAVALADGLAVALTGDELGALTGDVSGRGRGRRLAGLRDVLGASVAVGASLSPVWNPVLDETGSGLTAGMPGACPLTGWLVCVDS